MGVFIGILALFSEGFSAQKIEGHLEVPGYHIYKTNNQPCR